jgi:hypothetical protein
MRWAYWLLGIAGVVQYAVMVAVKPSGYVSLDTSYLVMWLAIIGAVLACCSSCWGSGGGCNCCGDDCSCGDCEWCKGDGHGPGEGHEGHEGHSH